KSFAERDGGPRDVRCGRRYLARGGLLRRMPARPPTTKRASRHKAAPLTEPRYLFVRDADSLERQASAGLEECRRHLAEILQGHGRRTVRNLLVPYDRLLFDLSEIQGETKFLFDVHPDAAVRTAADKWYQEAERFATDLALNRPLYDAFVVLDVSSEYSDTRLAVRKMLG